MRDKVLKSQNICTGFHPLLLFLAFSLSLIPRKSLVLNQHALGSYIRNRKKFLNNSSPNEHYAQLDILHSNRTVPSPNLCSPPLTLTALDMAKIVGNPHVLIHFGKKD